VPNPAIVYEADGYRTDGPKLMGRQAAGQGFLRAAVAASGGAPVVGYVSSKASAESFAKSISEIDPHAKSRSVNAASAGALKEIGHLYAPGPGIGDYARQRLRAAVDAWSITGVTHTTASHGAMDSLIDLPLAPVMPWDALVCTSRAVRETVLIVLEKQRDYLKWRLGVEPQWTLPQLPVIPIGVHCNDFAISPARREAARNALKIAPDEVVFLFVGRLSFHAKAHPHAMYAGLQAAADRTGKKLVLVQCGWFANDAIANAFVEGAQEACPGVRCLFTDGRAEKARQASWAAADVFVSLSDNIQETFGLAPVEAMAAGLPVVVTDWDGYKDTVRDGIDGFRIPTWAPGAGAGGRLAWTHEAGIDSYDMYCAMTCQFVAVDHRKLADAFAALALDEDLRRRMGAAGQARARGTYDWSVVYRAYQALWRQLDELRRNAGVKNAHPRAAAARLDPFLVFGHYPTHRIDPVTRVRRRGDHGPQLYAKFKELPLFSYAKRELPSDEAVVRTWAALGDEGVSLQSLASAVGMPLGDTARLVAALAKMGVVELEMPGK
jgi:glycosyltransferase involved in cell wall biosynthesis